MARPKPGPVLPETIIYPGQQGAALALDSDISAGLAQPPESAPTPSSRASERYIFGSGARPLDGFTIKRAIGRGGFGEVYYAVSDSGKEVALKLLLRNVDIEKRGVQQCMNLKSPHLITVYDMKDSDEGDTFVVMEYVAGPSLAQILARYPDGMPPHEVRMWMKGLVDGVAYLHDHGIVHRDLKPANLFLEEGVVKIGDYGLSKFIANSVERGHSTSVGTCHYMAPEIATGKYQKPIDIYAMGVILFEMVTGTVPFHGETAQEVLMKHLTEQPDLSPVPEPYRSIVARALVKDPARRPQDAVQLLLPGDEPAQAAVRFIGDQKTSPSGAVEHVVAVAAQAQAAASVVPPEPKPAEDVLRIEDDGVFYIGPNTMPPRRGWWDAMNRRRQTAKAATRTARTARKTARNVVQFRPLPVARRPMAPPPMPDPVPLPPARIRVAETAGSMILAAPLSALAVLPTAAAIGLHVPRDAGAVALLAAMILLGTWAIVIPTKFWEGRDVEGSTRRLLLGGVGAGLAALLFGFSQWAHVEPAEGGLDGSPAVLAELAEGMGLDGQLVTPLGFLAANALAFALAGWEGMTGRDRCRRFRVFPLIRAGVVGAGVSLLLPVPMPWLPAYMVAVSGVTQIVSPWCRRSAQYTLAVRKARKAGVAAA